MIRKQTGFSMIELLVSVVIMSIGVLGMAGLQIVSIQQNRSALLQGEATLLANDIIDRIRANPDTNYAAALDDTPSPTTNCVGSACTEAEMAAYDIAQWQCSINSFAADETTHPVCATFGIEGALPGAFCTNVTDACAGGSITLTSGVYEVSVQWTDQQAVDNAGGTVRSVSFNMRAP